MRASLSSVLDGAEHFLTHSALDRGPWLAVALAAGIAAWFALPAPEHWVAAAAAGVIAALAATALWKGVEGRTQLLLAVIVTGLLFSAGVGLAWARSSLVGAPPIERPVSATLEGRVLERIEQPADGRIRLVLATREEGSGRAIRVRVNVPLEADNPALHEGALVRLRARLMPPAPPMLPGGYDFARAAWFSGLSATGSAQGDVILLESAVGGGSFVRELQRSLSDHVRERLAGSPGAIAAAFASGDRGAIAEDDEEAMRDAGLTHLLSISGLHVSAVIAATYFIALKLMALWPWLALRVRLPLVAAAIAALAGIAYTLLTGAQVPTVRSCAAALLVLGAIALGREALSMRMVAVAGVFVLLLWPESLTGPSFQMSFAAVTAIIALHECGPVRTFLAPREEWILARLARRSAMLLITGIVIEIALMPIVLFHFHRAGLYGALANVVAIPLVTFVSMPLIALALTLDAFGLGAPVWWLAGQSLKLLLVIARFTAGQPGAVRLMPQMGDATFALFLVGGLWLALWRGRVRLFGLIPVAAAAAALAFTPVPDLLVSGDGRHAGIVTRDERLVTLRASRSDYASDNLLELAGIEGEPVAMDDWPQAQCNREFCVATVAGGGRNWHVLLSRSRELVEERALAAACERADIVIADRRLPGSCRPRWLKADRRTLEETGGLAIYLAEPRFITVAEGRGEHGWWRPASPRPR